MKANEFVKENGIEKCKRILDDLTEQGHSGGFYEELKRIVESHELVEKHGGLENAKDEYFSCVQNNEPASYVAKAIADVESCQ